MAKKSAIRRSRTYNHFLKHYLGVLLPDLPTREIFGKFSSIFLLEKRSWWFVPLCDSSSRLRAVLFEINGEHSPSVISSSRNPVTPVGYWRPVKSSSRNRHSSSTTTVRSSSTIQHREILRNARACLFIVYIARNTGRSRTRVSHWRSLGPSYPHYPTFGTNCWKHHIFVKKWVF